MEVTREQTEDGRVKIIAIMSEDELQEELAEFDDEEALMGRRHYCCTCPGSDRNSTNRHEVKASSRFKAHLKCIERCGGPHSMRKGRC